MAANVLKYASQVVESTTAAGLETALNTELAALAALNVGPNNETIGANILSVQYSTFVKGGPADSYSALIVYSYYAAAS